MSSKFVSKSHIFDNILKQLQVDNKGVPFTHCLVQNPLLTWGLPLEPGVALLLGPCPSLLLAPFQLPLLSLIRCWSWGAARSCMSGLVALETSQRGLILSLTSIDIHWYRIARSWMRMCNRRGAENAWCHYSNRVGCQMDWSGFGCLVRCFVGSTILVDIFCHFVPIFQRGVGGVSIGHHSDGVLDSRVQSFPEFYYGGLGIRISCFHY